MLRTLENVKKVLRNVEQCKHTLRIFQKRLSYFLIATEASLVESPKIYAYSHFLNFLIIFASPVGISQLLDNLTVSVFQDLYVSGCFIYDLFPCLLSRDIVEELHVISVLNARAKTPRNSFRTNPSSFQHLIVSNDFVK